MPETYCCNLQSIVESHFCLFDSSSMEKRLLKFETIEQAEVFEGRRLQ